MAEKEEKKEETTPSQISRREFLRDAGLVVGGATIGSMAVLNACSGGEETTKTVNNTVTKTVTVTSGGGSNTVTVTAGTGETSSLTKTIHFTLNRYPTEVTVESGWDLRHLLHDRLGAIGVKDMCGGYGACGSCSVIVDGKPVLSCMTLAVECDGKNIETSEGIAAIRHPIIDAFITNDCMQCGYCTPGMVVTAKALLDRNPSPTKDEIEAAMDGNLCRCTVYPMVVPAINAAAAQLGGTQ
jgi:aerobic-type carbon monoxide dehydrogenase small subunit (CoxS/CutS family)